MPPTTTRVLHVDDDPSLLDLVKTYLERVDDLHVVSVSCPSAAVGKFESDDFDCIVSDYEMPEMDGISLLKTIRKRDEDIPFILYTGKGSEDVASKAISVGVSDYMQKSSGRDHYELLANRIRNQASRYWSERRIQQVYEAVDTVDQGFSIIDEDGTFIHVNTAYASTFGYERCELIGKKWTVLYREEDVESVQEVVINEAMTTGSWEGKTRELRKDGSEIILDHKLQFTSGGMMVCTIDSPTPASGTEPVAQPAP